jgi:hypothetical protein
MAIPEKCRKKDAPEQRAAVSRRINGLRAERQTVTASFRTAA